MPKNYFSNIGQATKGLGSAIVGRSTNAQSIKDMVMEAVMTIVGTKFTQYDPKGPTYVDNGYNENSTVYSVVSQASTKLASVPCYLKKESNKQSKSKHQRLLNMKGQLSTADFAQKRILESKAYDQQEINEPLEKPNFYQSWGEFYSLWHTFMLLNGNAYIYLVAPEDGMNKGQPMQVFLLPAQYVQIVLKTDYTKEDSLNIANAVESPIDYYILTIGNSYVQFKANKIIHTKFPNPNYNTSGSHLYGQAPLRAGLGDLKVSNDTNKQNIKSMQNAGVYGFISGTDANRPLTPEQAQALKEKLIDMSNDITALNRYSGSSVPVGFTKLSLDTKDLLPFEFLSHSAGEICNVFSWPAELLAVNGQAKYDNMDVAWKMAISNRIQPDLCILQEALNDHYYPRFRGYEGVTKIFDTSELPEMQADMEKLTQWLKEAFDRGVISPDEYRMALKYPEVGDELMQTRFIKQGYVPLSDVLLQDNPLDKDEPLKL
jgi:HK97 family phage portal protein